jgi:hypothetical protein
MGLLKSAVFDIEDLVVEVGNSGVSVNEVLVDPDIMVFA